MKKLLMVMSSGVLLIVSLSILGCGSSFDDFRGDDYYHSILGKYGHPEELCPFNRAT